MTTRQAFKKLISQRGTYHQLEVSPGSIRYFRNAIKNKEWPSEEKMKELLIKGGWLPSIETFWVNPEFFKQDIVQRSIKKVQEALKQLDNL